MSPAEAQAWVREACEILAGHTDELGRLDAVAGDGDLGFTVSSGARAVVAALEAMEPDIDPATMLRAAGAAFARGNPSSFAALTGAGLLAAATAFDGQADFSREPLVAGLRLAADRIAERGRAQVGDRTVLDALVPSIDALANAPGRCDRGLESMVAAAETGTAATAEMTPRRGRAAWVGERGRGTADAGATAFLFFLRALAETAPVPR